MKYNLLVVGNDRSENWYGTESRDSKKAVRDHGAYRCYITNKHGKIISVAEHSDDFGTYNILFDENETIEIPEI